MPLTRISAEDDAFAGAGPKLALVGIAPATEDNPAGRPPGPEAEPDESDRAPTLALNRPLARALLGCRLDVADPGAVTDNDLAGITPALWGQFQERLLLACLDLVLSRWNKPDQDAGPSNSKSFGDLYKSIQADVARIKAEIVAKYEAPESGSGRVALGLGYIQR